MPFGLLLGVGFYGRDHRHARCSCQQGNPADLPIVIASPPLAGIASSPTRASSLRAKRSNLVPHGIASSPSAPRNDAVGRDCVVASAHPQWFEQCVAPPRLKQVSPSSS